MGANVAMMKYNAGNIRSVDYAMKRKIVGCDYGEQRGITWLARWKVYVPGVGRLRLHAEPPHAAGLDETSQEPQSGLLLERMLEACMLVMQLLRETMQTGLEHLFDAE